MPATTTHPSYLRLALQPVLDLHNGRIEYLEAYLRLSTQDHRTQLLAAEDDGSIIDLDMAVLALALPLLQRGYRLALNISPHTVLTRQAHFTQPLLALPAANRPIIEINDPYLLDDTEQARLATLLRGLPIGLNHYQGTAIENDVLASLKPAWAKFDGTALDNCATGLGCNTLQQALATCSQRGINLVITRIETAAQLEQIRYLCGARWGQGNFLASATERLDYPPALPPPIRSDGGTPEAQQPTAEACWHCLYSRLSSEQAILLSAS